MEEMFCVQKVQAVSIRELRFLTCMFIVRRGLWRGTGATDGYTVATGSSRGAAQMTCLFTVSRRVKIRYRESLLREPRAKSAERLLCCANLNDRYVRSASVASVSVGAGSAEKRITA